MKRNKKNENLGKVLTISLAVVLGLIVLVAWAVAIAVVNANLENDPGTFGDWLGYWGNICSGIIGAIVAALISFYVSRITNESLNHKRDVESYKFKIQVEGRKRFIEELRNLENGIFSFGKGIQTEKASKKEYVQDSKNGNLKVKCGDEEQKLVDSAYVAFDGVAGDISKIQNIIKKIQKDIDYPIMAQLSNGDNDFNDLIDSLDKCILQAGNIVENLRSFDMGDDVDSLKVMNSYSSGMNHKDIKSITINEFRDSQFYKTIDELPDADYPVTTYRSALEMLTEFLK